MPSTIIGGQLPGSEPMQVVSGRIDSPTVHFEAPSRREALNTELDYFIRWLMTQKKEASLDLLLRAAITHIWFVIYIN